MDPYQTTTRALFAMLLLAPFGGCGADPSGAADTSEDGASAVVDGATQAEIAQLTLAMRELPGELVVTRTTTPAIDAATAAQMVRADKVIHVFSNGAVKGYVHATEEVPDRGSRRVFRELGGDIMIGPSEDLPAHVARREEAPKGRTAEAVGLSQGNGTLWMDGTVAYEIDASFANAGELSTLRAAIGSWNDAVDGGRDRLRVRFVPRYQNDGRAYVRFVRSTDPSYCGQSQVGVHANVFSNWWSHNINITCVSERTIHHEMGHTAGLYHEQQRCDRDQYVRVTTWGTDYDRYCGGGVQDYLQYNYLSVMHYAYNGYLFQITPTGVNNRGLPGQAGSAPRLDTQDVQAINLMYTGQRSLPLVGPGVFYNLVPQNVTTRAVGVPGASLNNGTRLIIWDRGPLDQQWELRSDGNGFFEVRNRVSGKCMEVYNFSMSDGASIVQWDCWGGDNQKWTVTPSTKRPGNFDLINKFTGKALDVTGAGTANGTPMEQWGYNSGDNQRFQLVRAY